MYVSMSVSDSSHPLASPLGIHVDDLICKTEIETQTYRTKVDTIGCFEV